jgi:hypothetical protein
MSRFIEILNYVETSFDNKPAFIIRMSNGIFISCGCIFIRNSEEKRLDLVDEYGLGDELIELMDAPPIETKDLVNGESMFEGCHDLTRWTHPLQNLRYGERMFYHSTFTQWTVYLARLKYANCMFYHAEFREWNVPLPKLMFGCSMFYNAKLTKWVMELPKLMDGTRMFYTSEFKDWDKKMPYLLYTKEMFHNSKNSIS